MWHLLTLVLDHPQENGISKVLFQHKLSLLLRLTNYILVSVTQYDCSTMPNLGGKSNCSRILAFCLLFHYIYFLGEDGCLQYFTGTTGEVASFNFPTQDTQIGSTSKKWEAIKAKRTLNSIRQPVNNLFLYYFCSHTFVQPMLHHVHQTRGWILRYLLCCHKGWN